MQQVRRRTGLLCPGAAVLSVKKHLSGAPKPLQFIKRTGFGRHKVDNYRSHIDEVPFVIRRGPPVPAEYFNLFFQGKGLYLPVEALQVGIAGNGGNNKKIGPAVQFPEIQNNNVPAAAILKQPAQFHRQPFAGPAVLNCR
jgi:hypothetical protein